MRVSVAFTLAAVIALAACAKGKGGSDDSSSGGPMAPTVQTPDGEPTSEDWWNLSGELPAIAIAALQEAVASNVPAPSLTGPVPGVTRFLNPPTSAVLASGTYFCCGANNSSSFITVSGAVSPAAGGGSTYTLDFSANSTQTTWTSSKSSASWPIVLSGGGLRLTSNLTVSGSEYQSTQTLRIQGVIAFIVGGATRTQPVDVSISYTNFLASSQAGTATGQMGPVPLMNTALPTQPTLAPGVAGPGQRCSMPREGCGPLASGDQPCTKYPRCPGT